MKLRSLCVLSAVIMSAFVFGCGGGDDNPGTDANTTEDNGTDTTGQDNQVVGLSVETVVSSNQATVGEEITVECRVSGEGSESATAGFAITGGDTFTKDGGKVTFTAAGTYQVACSVEGTEVTDSTPETIVVGEGQVTKITTTLADDTIDAGSSTTVTCKAFDKFGNELSISMVIAVPADLSVTGNTVTGTKAGLYKVECGPAETVEGVVLESDELTVKAGQAAGLQLTLVPEKANYRVGNQVKVGFTLVDQYGNPVDGGAITAPTVNPTEGITQISEEQFQFAAEGVFTFSACVVDDPNTCDTIDAYCDGTAPLLTLEYPERAAMLGGDRNVVVTGTVHDDVGGLAELTINGTTVSVKDDGTFEFPMNAVQGLNIIDAVATDVFGLKVRSMRSYLFSDVYYPAVPEDSKLSLIPNSVQAYLDDKLLDSDDPADKATLAAIAEEVVSTLDIKALLPNPIATQKVWPCEYDVSIKTITFDKPQVEAYFHEGGISLDVVIPNFSGTVGVVDQGEDWYCVKEDGTMSAKKLVVKTGINISVDPVTHMLRVSSKGTDASFEELDISIGWAVDWLLGLLNGTITDLLKSTINDQVDGVINDLQSSVNEAIAEPIQIPIDGFIPGMANMILNVTIQPEKTTFVTEGGQLDVSLAVTADKHIDREVIPGSIGRAACLSGQPETFEFDTENPYKVNLSAFDDLISQAAFALWYTGGLKINLTPEAAAEMGLDLSQYGFADLAANIDALLPPIVATCGRENLVVQLGDAYLELSTSNFLGNPLDMHAFLFAELEAQITARDNEDGTQTLLIQILPPNRLDLNIVEINPEWANDQQTLIDMITGIIPGLIKDPFEINIPKFNLKELTAPKEPPAPGETPLVLPDLDLYIVIKQIEQIIGHTVVGADLRVETPTPAAP